MSRIQSEGTERQLVLENPYLRLTYDLAGEGLSLVCRGKPEVGIEGSHVAVEVDDSCLRTCGRPVEGHRSRTFEDELGAGKEIMLFYTLDSIGITLKIKLYSRRPNVTINMVLRNRGTEPLRIGRVYVLDVTSAEGGVLSLGKGLDSAKIYLESNNLCWTGVKDLKDVGGEGRDVAEANPILHGKEVSEGPVDLHRSGWLGVLFNPVSEMSLLGGFLTTERALSEVDTAYKPDVGITAWRCVCAYDGLELSPGEELKVERLYIDLRADPLEALEAFGDAVAKVNHIPAIPPSETPLLWCSWYSHRLTITERAVLDHAEIIAKRFKEYGVDLLQIDYGWNWRDTPGEWRAHSERFPHGMKWLADKLGRMGLKLGLWVAPTYIGSQSSFYREHPECLRWNPLTGTFVQSDWRWSSQPKETWQKVALLDCTKPASQEWLKDTFKEMCSWGVKYYKLDFLAGGSVGPMAFAVPGSENAYRVRDGEQVRIGLSAIREAVGRDAYLLGCNLPISHGLGLVSAIFGAMDVGNATGNFEHLKSRMTTIISRYWQQKRLWHVDPDVLYLGGEFLKPGEVCSVGEARIRATAVALSGGPVLMGDDLTALPEERMAMYALCLPSYGVSARPVDLFKDDYPRIWDLEVVADWGRWHVVGLFNYDDGDRIVRVDFEDLKLDPNREYLVWEFWEEEFLGMHMEKVEVIVPKQSARVLAIRELTDRPAVLSTNLHLTQGGVEFGQVEWDERSATLRGLCRRAEGAEGSIFVYVPNGYRVERGGEMVGPNVARIELAFSKPLLQWEVKFYREAAGASDRDHSPTGGER